jgi:hypothetical protein
VVKITNGTEETQGRTLLVGQDQSLFSRTLELKHLNDGAASSDGALENVLVYISCVLGGLLEESLVGDEIKAGLRGAGVGLLEGGLVYEVTSELLADISRKTARRTEGFDTVAEGALGVVEVFFVNTLLVTGTGGRGDTRLAGVDIYGVVDGFLIQANFELLVVSCESGNLGGVEGQNVVDNAMTGSAMCFQVSSCGEMNQHTRQKSR